MNRIAGEEHLIASIKHKTPASEYSPVNYYEVFLRQQIEMIGQDGKPKKISPRTLREIFYDCWLSLTPVAKEGFRAQAIFRDSQKFTDQEHIALLKW